MSTPALDYSAYRVGWICALQGTELPVAEAMRDEDHASLLRVPGDNNVYSLGKIGEHNVAIACCPAGKYGTETAATVANNMHRTFPNIEIMLMVGIGGGLPNMKDDIRLGDVVVSQGNGNHGGFVRYDMGKRTEDGFLPKRYLTSPPPILGSATATLYSLHKRKGSEGMIKFLAGMLDANSFMADEFDRPAAEHDIMSVDIARRCLAQMPEKSLATSPESFQLAPRKLRNSINLAPKVHYGLIASGNEVVASYAEAERIEKLVAGDDKILCFEMEAAGLVDNLPCIVIRGISDYADALKNDHWQTYAAATAAAYAKELLSVIPAQAVAGREARESTASGTEDTATTRDRSRSGRMKSRSVNNTIGDINVSGTNRINANNTYF